MGGYMFIERDIRGYAFERGILVVNGRGREREKERLSIKATERQ